MEANNQLGACQIDIICTFHNNNSNRPMITYTEKSIDFLLYRYTAVKPVPNTNIDKMPVCIMKAVSVK
ncbi:hypothetical protein GCM10007216_23370 [Thalassobacillus devorans]|uniref:Uncharacterized protein n=1 Tax=Thalassobacillus devorans TaxID=279813 RepID=A0ABQ1P6A1_9BACI|nr:hypothetical protein GCM10007216_23370 [Thalassobacillus devorans]